jgi:hypothetical protein
MVIAILARVIVTIVRIVTERAIIETYTTESI